MHYPLRSTLLVVVFLVAFLQGALAQTKPPLPTTNIAASLSIDQGKPRVILYEDAYNDFEGRTEATRIYHHSPVLAVYSTKQQELDGQYRLMIELLVNPGGIEDLIRETLKENKDAKSQSIAKGVIQPLDTARLEFKLDDSVLGVSIKSKAIETLTIQYVKVFTDLTDEAKITALEEAMKDPRSVPLYAEYDFQGADVGTIKLTVDVSRITKSKTFSDLSGRGAPSLATRERLSDIAGEVLEQGAADLNYDMENIDVPHYLKILTDMMEGALAQVQQLDQDRKKAAERLRALGLEPSTFRADLIRKSRERLNEKLHNKFKKYTDDVYKRDQDDLDFFTNFDDEMTLNYKGDDIFTQHVTDVMRETLAERGVDISFEGEKFVPKSVKIFVDDATKIDTTVLRELTIRALNAAKQTTKRQDIAPDPYESLAAKQQYLVIEIAELDYSGHSRDFDPPYNGSLDFQVEITPSVGEATSKPKSLRFELPSFHPSEFDKKQLGKIGMMWVFPLGTTPPPIGQIVIRIGGGGHANGTNVGLYYRGPSTISFRLDDESLFQATQKREAIEFSRNIDGGGEKAGVGFHLLYTVKIQKGLKEATKKKGVTNK